MRAAERTISAPLAAWVRVRDGDQVDASIEQGALVRVLADWCPPFLGYHLYYPSRRQLTPTFALVVEALRYRP